MTKSQIEKREQAHQRVLDRANADRIGNARIRMWLTRHAWARLAKVRT
jgi:hypothetical protein